MLIQALGAISLALLVLSGALGLVGTLGAATALAHLYAGMAAVLGVLFSESVAMVFFLGIARRLRDLASRRAAVRRLLGERPLPRSPVPISAAAVAAVMAAFILGGGAHTRVLSVHLHGAVAALAVALQGAALLAQRRAFRSLAATVGAIEARVGTLD
ncbi:MAG: hypothetical protein PVF68_03965 [Acidobacteriota bacterium]